MADSIMCRLFNEEDKTKKNSFKARIVSSLSRKLSVLLSLTKSQNDQLLSFWKTMMSFIHPGSEEITQKIHASYTSCMRSSMKDEQKKKDLSKQYMKECSFLSIAVDSALVMNEHLLSCFVRFSFEERTLQIPLFFLQYVPLRLEVARTISFTTNWWNTSPLLKTGFSVN